MPRIDHDCPLLYRSATVTVELSDMLEMVLDISLLEKSFWRLRSRTFAYDINLHLLDIYRFAATLRL